MAEPLKNHFDRPLIELLAECFLAEEPSFDSVAFTETVLAGLPDRELKDRINLVADEARSSLPSDYATALDIVVRVAETDGVDGFAAWPLCSFVERHGVDDPARSLAAMERLTRRFSCEFAIRPFLEEHLDVALDSLRSWAESDDEHVRRLASEGTRPYLPWGPKVQALLDDPGIGIALLHTLRHDPSETVRRSVANHLNDIARNHPDRVAEICADWSADPSIEPAMIRHALRSLVKKGHAGALAVLGFTTAAEVVIDSFQIEPAQIALGRSITLTTSITSSARADQRLVVDFVVHHIGATGAATPKVFKWTTIELAPGESTQLSKSRKIATASTRRYHAGTHRVELQVAGTVEVESSFELLDSSDDAD